MSICISSSSIVCFLIASFMKYWPCTDNSPQFIFQYSTPPKTISTRDLSSKYCLYFSLSKFSVPVSLVSASTIVFCTLVRVVDIPLSGAGAISYTTASGLGLKSVHTRSISAQAHIGHSIKPTIIADTANW